jgi:hypothetical protein
VHCCTLPKKNPRRPVQRATQAHVAEWGRASASGSVWHGIIGRSGRYAWGADLPQSTSHHPVGGPFAPFTIAVTSMRTGLFTNALAPVRTDTLSGDESPGRVKVNAVIM